MTKNMIAAATAAAALTLGASAAEPPLAGPEEEPQSVHSYILLDRTGSMSDIWDEALGSVNAYADAVGKAEEGETDTLETSVTLAAFDYQQGFQFDVLRKGVTPSDWQNVSNNEVSPRGMTPLFDAINRTITMAEADNPEKAVIVIMTDGLENSSREVTRDGAKAAMDRAKARGWEVVFLGAEFASFGDADGVGIARSKQMSVGAGSLAVTNERLAKKAREYGKGDAAEIIFDEEDRAVANEEDVQQRKGASR